MQLSNGPVLELGCGPSSTPILYWLAFDKNREFYSYDNHQDYVDMMRKYGVQKIDDWDTLQIDKHKWGMAFIDHHPSIRRGFDASRLAQAADYVVIHDSNDEKGHGYTNMFPDFKYRYDYTKTNPFTTVLSNFNNLDNL